MDSMPVTHGAPGCPLSTTNKVLDTAAGMTQDFRPLKNVCGFLNAFHSYVEDPTRCVETNHYCAHLNDDVRQCLLYDSPEKDARLIGIEYMVSAKLFETLPPEERTLWHSHVFEVKSGMLIMPKPAGVPEAAWEVAENKEMEDLVTVYGKVFHLWQTDKGHKLPMGMPKLMTSFTEVSQMDFDKVVSARDKKFGSDYKRKQEARKYIPEPQIHPDADAAWQKTKSK
ncbi:DUF1264-domain-containing protein [Trichodelitschia bisporula]|uniref:DUF1264-domain-containing protein n=1 Tax=Trichodelitschia bisporula TaxID=703511 RepID=A0A6G1HRX8_9PEZI|nr:DUF1264-domain-containing protein [Trichodelitschia bisporula]